MKIKIDLRPGTLVEITLKNGKKITDEDIESIDLDPYFTRRGEVVEMVDLISRTSDGREVDKCALTVAGTTGRVSRKEAATNRKRVSPAIDDKPKKPANPPTPGTPNA